MYNYVYSLLNKTDYKILKDYYLADNLYLDMDVYIVDKCTYRIVKYGNICNINGNVISLLIKNKYTLHVNKDDYYFFIKPSNKLLYQYLLNQL